MTLLTAFVLLCVLAIGPTRMITGKLRNDKGEVVPFANLAVKGTNRTVTADTEGNSYRLSIENNSTKGVVPSDKSNRTGVRFAAGTALLTKGKDLPNWAATPDKLKAIWMQKWVALTSITGLESWAWYRRTGFPVTPKSKSAPSGSTDRPVRFFYPQTEVSSNKANTPKQAANDTFSARMFWDVD